MVDGTSPPVRRIEDRVPANRGSAVTVRRREAAGDLEAELAEAPSGEPAPAETHALTYQGRKLTEDEATAARLLIEVIQSRNG